MALTLTRKVGQQVRIGDVVLTVVAIKGDRGACRLGIAAPAEVRVDRMEVRIARTFGTARSKRKGGGR